MPYSSTTVGTPSSAAVCRRQRNGSSAKEPNKISIGTRSAGRVGIRIWCGFCVCALGANLQTTPDVGPGPPSVSMALSRSDVGSSVARFAEHLDDMALFIAQRDEVGLGNRL